MKRFAAALLLLGCAACSRCGQGKSAASAEELLPASPALAASTGTLAALGPHLAAFIERAALVPGGEDLLAWRRQLAQQLGFDPLTRDGLLSAGLDPERAASFSATLPEGPEGRPAWVVAVPLTSPEKFAGVVDPLLQQRAGFPLRTEEAKAGVKVVVFARAATPGPRLAYAIVRGYGVLARSGDPASDIALVAARPRDQSLATDPGFAAARAPADLIVFAPAGSELGSRVARRPLPGNTSVALTFSPSSVQAQVRAQLDPASAASLAALLPGGGGQSLELLPPEAPVQARLGLKAAEVAAWLERVPLLKDALGGLRREVAAKGVDLDKDLFAALEPGVVLSIGAAPRLDLSKLVDLGFADWRQRSPFEFVQLLAVARVANRERLLLALDAVAQALPRVGAQAVRSGDDWQVTYPGGAGARFGVQPVGGQQLAYLMGGGPTPADLKPHPGAQRPQALAGATGVSAAIDVGKLYAQLQALPEAAYGGGPQAMIARSFVDKVVKELQGLRASFHLEPAQGGLAASVQLDLAPPAR